MKKVTRQEAIDLIETTANLVVVFSTDSCAICKNFIPEVLEVIEPALTNHVTMVHINSTAEKAQFGPDAYPTTYCFKNGVRIDWIKGSGPLEGVRQKLLALYPLPDTAEAAPSSPENQGDTQSENQGNEG